MTHEIKIYDYYADAVISGEKTFEVRYNDRGYQKGDFVKFKVMDTTDSVYRSFPLTSHPLHGKVYEITYILSGFGVADNWVVFSIRPVEEEKDD